MDMTLLGETTAKLMDSMENSQENGVFGENPKILAIGIIAIIEGEDEDGDQMSFTRTFSSESFHYRQVGLFEAALDTVKDGRIPG